MTILCAISLLCAAIPAALFCWNLILYRQPPPPSRNTTPRISVLIPARNEERSIQAAVESVLNSTGVGLELIVLDDASADRTASIVGAIADRDPRLRAESAPPLPSGWNGKQHACHVLANLASHETLVFLDADVRLAPGALARMAAFLDASRSRLVSGFPRQQTGTSLERLLLPLIHFILLGYLPLAAMRRSPAPGFAAGCGQFLMVDRRAYRAAGGHAAIRATMHDGLLLPRLFREHGFRTDIADMTTLATCRMYRSAAEVWRGLGKNATEGLAAPARIVPFTLLLFMGQVMPLLLLVAALGAGRGINSRAATLALLAVIASYLPRILAIRRFRHDPIGALFHPVGVLVLLVLQWSALLRKQTGHQVGWKQRSYNPG